MFLNDILSEEWDSNQSLKSSAGCRLVFGTHLLLTTKLNTEAVTLKNDHHNGRSMMTLNLKATLGIIALHILRCWSECKECIDKALPAVQA